MISKFLGSNKRAYWLVFGLSALQGFLKSLQLGIRAVDIFSMTVGTGFGILILCLFLGGITLGIEILLEKAGVLKPPDAIPQNEFNLLDNDLILKEEIPTQKIARIWFHTFFWVSFLTLLAVFDAMWWIWKSLVGV